MSSRYLPVSWVRHVNYPIIRALTKSKLSPALPEQLRTQWLSPEDLAELQLSRLNALLQHAHAHCPFYTERLDAAGLRGGRVSSLEALSDLPMLTKRDIQQHRADIIADCFDEPDLRPDHTGGSTGDPLHFYNDRGEHFLNKVCREYRGNLTSGWHYGMRTVRLWGAGVDVGQSKRLTTRLYQWALNDRVLDCMYLDEDIIDQHIAMMGRHRVQVVVAYTTIAYLFATKLLERGTTVVRPNTVIVSAEMLTQPQREVIEAGFGCKAFNRYGCREVGLVAAECDAHRGMHIGTDQLVVEVVDDDGRSVRPGEMGRILLTDLFNYGMPFIRYDVGDMGILSDEACPCGRSLPLLAEVVGRDSDVIRMPSGRRIACTAVVTVFAKQLKGVANLQLVRNGVTTFTLRIMRGSDYQDGELAYLQEQLSALLAPEAEVSYEFVDDIARSPSGKYQFLVSELPADGVH